MPTRSLKQCRHAGCRALVPDGLCPAHRRAKYAAQDRVRGTASERGYDAAWARCRRLYLAAFPRCIVCGQRATEVDHIVSVAHAPDLRLSWSNLRSMCKPHHSARTMRDQVRRAP